MLIVYRRLCTLGLFALVARVGDAQQPPMLVDAKPTCSACRIVLEKKVRLSDPEADINGSAGNITVIDRDSRGRYWIADFGSPSAVMVFDARGKYVGKVGRPGSGPGEFRFLYSLAIRNDTVHAVDQSLARRTIISANDMRIVGSTSWESPNAQFIPLKDGSFLTSGSNAPGRGAGNPIHRLSGAGSHVESYGATGKPHFRWMDPWLQRRLGSKPDGSGFYTIGRRDYVVEEWSMDGRLVRRLRPNLSWFPISEPTQSPRPSSAEGLPPQVAAIWVDSAGLLYVVSHARQSNWRRGLGEVRSERGVVTGIADRNKYYDSVIDVWDMRAGRILASQRFDLYYDGPAGAGELYIKGDDPEDFLEIWRVQLVRP